MASSAQTPQCFLFSCRDTVATPQLRILLMGLYMAIVNVLVPVTKVADVRSYSKGV